MENLYIFSWTSLVILVLVQCGSIGAAKQAQFYAKLDFKNILIFQDFFSLDFRLLLFSK